MGTRADFYIGRGEQAEWLGSIAWDGDPYGMPVRLLHAATEQQFRAEVEIFLASRDDATLPDQGWPWPWSNSHTTDYAYAFDGDMVWATCFGYFWFDPKGEHPECDDETKHTRFPDMTARQNFVHGGPRSGVISVSFDTVGRVHVD